MKKRLIILGAAALAAAIAFAACSNDPAPPPPAGPGISITTSNAAPLGIGEFVEIVFTWNDLALGIDEIDDWTVEIVWSDDIEDENQDEPLAFNWAAGATAADPATSAVAGTLPPFLSTHALLPAIKDNNSITLRFIYDDLNPDVDEIWFIIYAEPTDDDADEIVNYVSLALRPANITFTPASTDIDRNDTNAIAAVPVGFPTVTADRNFLWTATTLDFEGSLDALNPGAISGGSGNVEEDFSITITAAFSGASGGLSTTEITAATAAGLLPVRVTVTAYFSR
jgi:hypothetical protein